jgi:hypothetical protein
MHKNLIDAAERTDSNRIPRPKTAAVVLETGNITFHIVIKLTEN